MKQRPLIFLTNDDSYLSKGFRAAVELASEFGDVITIAPERVQSGMSQAITINMPLFLREVERREGVEIYAFSGTPVDCAKVAFDHILANRKVDLVLSGINHGSNAAVNVMYSGTMGAAIEGSFYNIPSLGLSLDDHAADADFRGAVKYGRKIIASLLEHAEQLPRPLCLNVNFPDSPSYAGVKVCRQAMGRWANEWGSHQHPRGGEWWWLTGEFALEENDPSADRVALDNNYVAITPTTIDFTDYRLLQDMQGWGL